MMEKNPKTAVNHSLVDENIAGISVTDPGFLVVNIAIDGPSGAGKSTIAKQLADMYNIAYLDTGAMYRAIGLFVDDRGISSDDEVAVSALLPMICLEIEYLCGVQNILLNGLNVSTRIREHRVSKLASNVSKIPAVRIKLVEMQRKMAAKMSVVLDGRDITSYVLPNAKYKFYLDAKPEVRAKRRYDELTDKGQVVEYNKILSDIIDRDANDMNRSFAPLIRTADSIYIDSSDMSSEQVLDEIITHISKNN